MYHYRSIKPTLLRVVYEFCMPLVAFRIVSRVIAKYAVSANTGRQTSIGNAHAAPLYATRAESALNGRGVHNGNKMRMRRMQSKARKRLKSGFPSRFVRLEHGRRR